MEYKDIVSFFENDLKIKLLMLDMGKHHLIMVKGFITN